MSLLNGRFQSGSQIRIFLYLSLALLSSDFLFVSYNYVAAQNALMESFSKRGREQKSAFQLLLNSTLANMQQMATFISLDPKIQQLFLKGKQAVEAEGGGAGGSGAARIRQALLEEVGPRWEQMTAKYDVRQLHFHLGPGSLSFLRVHQPDKFGDRMDGLRYIIEDSYKRQSTLTGFETGRIYSGLRGVVPVYADDPANGARIHVGTLEVGTSFESMFEIIDRQLSSGIAALLKSQHVNQAMWEEFVKRQFVFSNLGCDCKVEAASRPVKEILQATMPYLEGGRFSDDHTHWVEHAGHNYSVTHFPLFDYIARRNQSQTPVGVILLWTSVNEEVQAYHKAIRSNLAIGAFGFIILELLIWGAIRVVSSSLHRQIDERTHELDEEVKKRKHQQYFLQTVIDAVQDPIMVIGGDYQVKLINKVARESALCQSTEVTSYCYSISHNQPEPCSGDGHPCPLEIVFKTGNATSVVHTHYDAQGEERLIELSASPLNDHDGALIGIVETQRDITERSRAERELVIAKEEAEKANMAKSDFLANMSHEIRTPMNVVLGMGELLLEEETDSQKRHYLEVVQSASEALLTIINDILDLSRIEAGEISLSIEPIRTSLVVRDVVRIFAHQADQKELALNYDISENVPEWAYSDRTRLQQILINLVGNAMKFTEKGSVTLAVIEKEGDRCQFTVSDTGVGISDKKQAVIFSPFVQADTSVTRRFGGTGLGLAICKAIVQRMDGSIGVDSKEGEGSKFYFEIPLVRTEAPDSPILAGNKAEETQKVTRLKLLVAEDSEDNITLLKAYLKNTPHQISFARTGAQAVDAFKSGAFDLVLMDVQMPEMDGYAATQAIRQLEQEKGLAATPIFALSAHVLTEAREQSLKAGCDGHLSKPIKKKFLLDFLGSLTSSS
ncbi:ATP-binding protein [Magnetofaba australis]|uniref:Sensory/regulatory protein RpfC n=1 Tax=Magnetofaba australis IT-1 TaxID=1434232 RepID=A0A1Y2K5U9_9PROT|nr:ATP-binding protein [Magnetofaba australis]OSM05051.1 putative histidine kinase [Magnetofaba australis IT-1]